MSLSLTVVVVNFVQEADALQMLGCGHRQGQYIANGLMEARVSSITEGHRLVFVLQEVLNMAHLMMYRDQVIHSDNSALFYPEDTNKGTLTMFSAANLLKKTCSCSPNWLTYWI